MAHPPPPPTASTPDPNEVLRATVRAELADRFAGMDSALDDLRFCGYVPDDDPRKAFADELQTASEYVVAVNGNLTPLGQRSSPPKNGWARFWANRARKNAYKNLLENAGLVGKAYRAATAAVAEPTRPKVVAAISSFDALRRAYKP